MGRLAQPIQTYKRCTLFLTRKYWAMQDINSTRWRATTLEVPVQGQLRNRAKSRQAGNELIPNSIGILHVLRPEGTRTNKRETVEVLKRETSWKCLKMDVYTISGSESAQQPITYCQGLMVNCGIGRSWVIKTKVNKSSSNKALAIRENTYLKKATSVQKNLWAKRTSVQKEICGRRLVGTPDRFSQTNCVSIYNWWSVSRRLGLLDIAQGSDSKSLLCAD
jgi:hypothetical protein